MDTAKRLHQTLPVELVYRVFTFLTFRDKLRCQSVCKAWNGLLRHPSTASVWGTVTLNVASLWRRVAKQQAFTSAALIQLYAPATRWISLRHRGITTIKLQCLCCTTAAECRGLRPYLTALLGCLRHLSVDLALFMQCHNKHQLTLVCVASP
ncbi:hypothetical protein WJX73_008134 [Symbiochloris irregularis]|uniref:F-box domain-containing protein n=1 Tax=Symbiochloris irregularis TaxID=706552 RepID=A0AAW1PFG2_9CHLO